MRLFFFIHSLSSGGAERVTANLANHWAAKGWGITIVTLAPRSLDFYQIHPMVERIALGLAGESRNVVAGLWKNMHRVRALRAVMRQAQPDIALGVMTTANVILALATRGLANVCAIGAEHIHPPQFPLSARWEALRRFTYGRLAAVVALTQESAKWLRMHTCAQRVPIIPNMALWPLAVQAPRLIPETGRIADRHILLAVGRLEKQKGFDWLVEAFTALAQKYYNWNLVILGEGPERRALEMQVQAAGLSGRVFLPGRAGNVGEWYERADLYVMSSRFEGFPLALAEALVHGLPAVSFDCDTGPRDIIRPEVDGLLVPPANVNALTAALDRLMGDAALRIQFGARAVEARARFSMERLAGMWENLFAEVKLLTEHAQAVSLGKRFDFGANWTRFLALVNEDRIRLAEHSLCDLLEVETLQGKSFLDIGSGSGLFSLAARRLGAKVRSVDYDPQSVTCTRELKRRYFPDDPKWTIAQGSVLDQAFLVGLGTFDVVYAWGVLHHTGDMWQALENVKPLVKPQGRLYVSIYNDQGRASVLWKLVKRAFCRTPEPLRSLILGLALVRLWGPTTVRDFLQGHPGRTWRNYGKGQGGRGMSPWRDVVDWVGGHPFEVAKPEKIVDLYRDCGFVLSRVKTCGGGRGCNEFVFARNGP